jgi:hypothetical protein
MAMIRLMRVSCQASSILLICGVILRAASATSEPTSPVSQDLSGSPSSFRGVAQGRFEIPPLKQPLRLEENAEIPIVLHDSNIQLVTASWSYDEAQGGDVPRGNSVEMKINYRPDLSAHVNFTPEGLGKVSFALTVYFEDGKMETERIETEVVLPEREPDNFYAITGVGAETSAGPGTIYMDLSERSNNRELGFRALYKGAAHSAPIPLKFLTLKVIATDENDPPIAFNGATGVIAALHIGHALVQANFKGVLTLVCVDVLEDARAGYDRTVCSELVPPGMTAPKSGFEDMSPPTVPKPPAQ